MSGAAGGAMAGLLIANNLKRLNEGIAAAPAAWAVLAAHGLTPATFEDRPAMQGAIRGVDCSVRIVVDLVQNAHTEVLAERSGGDATIGVYPSPAGVLKWMRDKLHGDVEIGEPPFDEAFLIKSRPHEAAAALLTPSIRERLFSLAGGKLVGLRVDAERATVLLNQIELDPTVIGVALEIVVEAAGYDGVTSLTSARR